MKEMSKSRKRKNATEKSLMNDCVEKCEYLYQQAQQVQHQNGTKFINMCGYSSVNKTSMSWRDNIQHTLVLGLIQPAENTVDCGHLDGFYGQESEEKLHMTPPG